MSRFAASTEIVHGPGTLARLPDEIARLGGHRVLLVSDRGLVAAGIVDRVAERLRAAGRPLATFLDVPVDPTFADVDGIAAAARAHRADTVVSVGSGSVLAAGRSAALAAANAGSSAGLAGRDRASTPPLLSICIPTTAGSGGEVSRHATISEASGHKSGIAGAWVAARVAILDADLLRSVPPRQAVASGVDALTHALEAHVSRRATPLTDALALASFEVLYRDLPGALSEPSIEVLDRLLLASSMANLACGNAGLGLIHGINKGLTYLMHGRSYPAVAYGEIHAILLPWVWAFNAPAAVERYARLATLMGAPAEGDPVRTAALGADRLRSWLAALGVPSRLPWDGCSPADVDLVVGDVLGLAMARDNPRPSTADDIRQIVGQCIEGW